MNLRSGTICFTTIKKRSTFVEANQATLRFIAKGFIIQVLPVSTPGAVGDIGFTATRKIGNAVIRNRAKRRMRALAQEFYPQLPCRQHLALVMIARKPCVDMPFAALREDMAKATGFIARKFNPSCATNNA